MTPADRARIAAEWGIDPAAIPEARIVPRGVSGETPAGHWSNWRERERRKFGRRRRFEALALREGRAAE
jgi:hypothetical protein